MYIHYAHKKITASPPSQPTDVHIINPQNLRLCWVTWWEGIKAVTQLTLRQEGIVHSASGPHAITRVPDSARGWQESQGQDNMMWERLTNPLWLPRPGKRAASRSRERQGKSLTPRASRRDQSSTDTSILAQWDPFQTSGLQNDRIRNLCCFQPLNWW